MQKSFLQDYTTCDLGALGDAEVMRGAICNIKGRMVNDFLVTRIRSGLLLRLHRDLVEPTFELPCQIYRFFQSRDAKQKRRANLLRHCR